MSDELFLNRYRIPSARAAWHDYRNGMYFVTLCTRYRNHFFGEIVKDDTGEPQMVLSAIGERANTCWGEIPSHFPHVETISWVIMPNHIHGILSINPIVGPYNSVETQNFASLQDISYNRFGPQSKNLASVIRGFKIGVTKFARKYNLPFEWQPRFHDHIIRDEDELNRITNYIENNVAKWEEDRFYG